MRVLGGQARGRRLKSVPGEATRPPLAKVRQAIFNILQAVTPGSTWLDLFAGTGSYSIEALSRGAAAVVMVELDPKAVAVIRDNLAATGYSERATVIRGDVLRELPRLYRAGRRFDVIGVTPPYFRGLGARVLEFLDENDLLAPSGFVYLQRHRREEIPTPTRKLEPLRDYYYGETVLSLFTTGGGVEE